MSIEQEEISTESNKTNNITTESNYLEEFERINETFVDEDPE
jgi:hypothetical protein